MAFVSVLQALVVSIAMWHTDSPAGISQTSSEPSAVIKPRRPCCETIRVFVQEYNRQKELSDRLVETDDDGAEMEEANDEMKASEADNGDDDEANMVCDDDSKQEPPDHIKLVMEVRTLSLLSLLKDFVISLSNSFSCV